MPWLFKDSVVIMKEIMSWLFKDTIVTVTWLNFDNAKSNSKNWPWKIKLLQMKFFLKKQLIKFSCTYQPLSLCKIKKRFLEPIQNYEDVPFSGPKWPICPQNFFLEKIINITFIYPFTLFIVQNFKKILKADR